jgi:FlaA1/EpsC-like NDP-sugar epimerase
MIHGVPVLGFVDDIEHLPESFEEILIALPSASAEQMRRIVAACERTGKRYRTMPGIGELIDGKVSLKAIREVTIEDILGRDEVHLNQDAIRSYLEGRRILVTGAGGSIGSELVRQICRFKPSKLGILEFSEFNLFSVESECRRHFAWIPVKSLLVDIRDRSALYRAFADFRPEVVFHAAAYKHVPIQEEHPHEAVRNNVIGTRNVIDCAIAAEVKRFVLVSTDKAVRPTSVMGTTKRVAEMMVECLNGKGSTRFMAVRFGNVLGSSGSVVPIFQQQIAQGGPVTVTHPEVTRYFMTIPEAAQLILQAAAMGEGGEIFILDMGKPVCIADLARDMIRLQGFEPDKDIPVHYIGLRPGEKLYEELITEGEGIVPTSHEKIRVIRGLSCDAKKLDADVEELVATAERADAPAIKKKLAEIVPEYTPHFD